MKPQSLISILVPAYNHEKFVEGCVSFATFPRKSRQLAIRRGPWLGKSA